VTFAIGATTKILKDGAAVTSSDLTVGELVDVMAQRPTASSATTTAQVIDIETPHEGGTVVQVTSSGFVLEDPQGFWHTVSTSSATTYAKGGATASSADVKVGTFVVAAGSVASDHTTLDATAVTIGLPARRAAGALGAWRG
jgi:hypothetical protein